ncbi:hypothetical protein BH160DRAFT_1484 [Burkholderia sp. H160]|nr:hypothetical protein BH160DRAFT_1484 [Burkholderia sp. H160]
MENEPGGAVDVLPGLLLVECARESPTIVQWTGAAFAT